MNRRERRLAAKGSRVAPAAPAAATAAALYEAGLQLFLSGRKLDAQICCEKALALDPGHADTLHLTGLLCLQAGQYDHALEWIARAIRQQPKADYLTNLGAALLNLGRVDDAVVAFDKAVQLKPDEASSWKNLAGALHRLGRREEAILGYRQALKLDASDWDAANTAGLILRELGRKDEALVYFDMHERMPLDSGLKFQMHAHAAFIRKRFEEGLDAIRSAHALNPADAEICNMAGIFLARLGRENEALQWYDRALGLRPNLLAALNNKAFAFEHLHRFAECLATYDQIRALDPNNAKAAFMASLVHLLTGNFEAGLSEREARWDVAGLALARFEFAQPRWLGNEPLDGKTILVFEDEGMGDTIQFSRYVPMLAARGARVILYVTDPVVPLLAGMPGVSQCIPRSVKALPAFDLQCPINSLPLAFGTRLDTIPRAPGYLPRPSEERRRIWEERLRHQFGAERKLRVGLVWSGNPNHTNDHNRSIPLATLSDLLDADAAFVSLQKGPKADEREDDKAALEQAGVVDLTAHLSDFAETAALVSQLDLVITVDTSVAHLAGALGTPTWVLLPYTPDWRWLLDRDDSPWYPSLRLFRQDETREYGRVVARVRSELDAMISGQKSA